MFQFIAPPAGTVFVENVPTLVLESTGAYFMDRARSRAELTHLQSVELVKTEATHWPLTERPEEVRRAIENWIERLAPSAQDKPCLDVPVA